MFQNLTMQIEFPQGFKNKFQELLGEEFPLLESCLYKRPKECIRVNTLKISKEELKERLERKGWKLEEVPWYENAFFVETQESTAKTKEFFLGYYYIQDAASLVPVLALDPKPGETILDACASPGSKTTFIAELMRNEGLIVANDVNPKRVKALSFNIQKIGAKNVVVTMMDARNISKLKMKFDKILLDVPCSASGTFISSFRVLEFWSQHVVERLSNLQKQLLRAAVEVLKEGGTLVYSTCSMDPEENEENMEYAIKKLGLKPEKIEIRGLKYRTGIERYGKKVFENAKYAIRFFPFDNQTEGFFVCKLRK
jgi:NOL1/NOP2/sun family putative RNA methylase